MLTPVQLALFNQINNSVYRAIFLALNAKTKPQNALLVPMLHLLNYKNHRINAWPPVLSTLMLLINSV